MRYAILLPLPVLACLFACGGADVPRGPARDLRPTTEAEMADRRTRMHQPRLAPGTNVTLAAKEASARGLVDVWLGSRPGEQPAKADNGTQATVIADAEQGFDVEVSIRTGEHAGRKVWVSRGDVHR